MKAAGATLLMLAGVMFGPRFAVAPAAAHTDVVATAPAPEAVHGPPVDSITMQFDEAVEPREIELEAPDGAIVGGVISSPKEGRLTFVPDRPIERPGQWTVVWSVTAADGDLTRGRFPFEIRAGGDSVPPLSDAYEVRSVPAPVFATDTYQDDSERSRWFYLSLGITLGLAIVTAWVMVDWWRERRPRAESGDRGQQPSD